MLEAHGECQIDLLRYGIIYRIFINLRDEIFLNTLFKFATVRHITRNRESFHTMQLSFLELGTLP